MNEITFNVTYKGKTYAYKSGAQAHIFHCGVYAEIDEKYGIDALLQYVCLVYDCYLSDSNNTNITELADHIAQHWEQFKDSDRFEKNITGSVCNEKHERNTAYTHSYLLS